MKDRLTEEDRLQSIKTSIRSMYDGVNTVTIANDIIWLVAQVEQLTEQVEKYRSDSRRDNLTHQSLCEVSYGRIIKTQDAQIDRMQAVIDAAREVDKTPEPHDVFSNHTRQVLHFALQELYHGVNTRKR